MSEGIKLENILDVDKFQLEVETLVLSGVNYLEAVLFWCGRNNIEIETIADIIKKNEKMKAMILSVATVNKLMKKEKYEGAVLPI